MTWKVNSHVIDENYVTWIIRLSSMQGQKAFLLILSLQPFNRCLTLPLKRWNDAFLYSFDVHMKQWNPLVRMPYNIPCLITFNFSFFADKRFVNWTLRILSVHGQKAPLPFIKSVEVIYLKSLCLFLFILALELQFVLVEDLYSSRDLVKVILVAHFLFYGWPRFF